MWDGEMARTVRAGLTPKKDLPKNKPGFLKKPGL